MTDPPLVPDAPLNAQAILEATRASMRSVLLAEAALSGVRIALRESSLVGAVSVPHNLLLGLEAVCDSYLSIARMMTRDFSAHCTKMDTHEGAPGGGEPEP